MYTPQRRCPSVENARHRPVTQRRRHDNVVLCECCVYGRAFDEAGREGITDVCGRQDEARQDGRIVSQSVGSGSRAGEADSEESVPSRKQPCEGRSRARGHFYSARCGNRAPFPFDPPFQTIGALHALLLRAAGCIWSRQVAEAPPCCDDDDRRRAAPRCANQPADKQSDGRQRAATRWLQQVRRCAIPRRSKSRRDVATRERRPAAVGG